MSRFIVGIGGTGARCVEAFVHLCALGMAGQEDKYHVVMIDPHNGDEHQKSVKGLISKYDSARSTFWKDHPIVAVDENNPLPFGSVLTHNSSVFQFNDKTLGAAVGTGHGNTGELVDLLYTKDEQGMPLDLGFRAHPSIGAAIFAKEELGGDSADGLAKLITSSRQAGETTEVFVFASIFGGTGAAGFPTLARLLNKVPDVSIAGGLMLPYFAFTRDNSDRHTPDSRDFLFSTKVGLKYYYEQRESLGLNRMYLVGDPELRLTSHEVTNERSANKAHYAELIAALGARDWFSSADSANVAEPIRIAGRQAVGALTWSDLPDGKGGRTTKKFAGTAARFYHTLGLVTEVMRDIRQDTTRRYHAPFSYRYDFDPVDDDIYEQLVSVESYFDDLMLWFKELAEVIGDNCVDVNLLQHVKKESGALTNLVLGPDGQVEPFESTKAEIWRQICKGPKGRTKGVRVFLEDLYRLCSKEF